MVGNVHAEIGRPPVAAQQHAILVVAEVRGAEEERAVLFVSQAELAETIDAFAHLAALVQFAFALPAVVSDAEAFGGAPLLGDQLVAAESGKIRKPFRFRCIDPALAVTVFDALGDRNQILAGVAIFRKRIAGIEERAVAGIDRTPERVELAARIVDDPLDVDVVAAETHRVGQRRADGHRPPLHDDQRSGRIGTAELQRDAHSRGAASGRSPRPFGESRRRRSARPSERARKLMKPPTASMLLKRSASSGLRASITPTMALAISCGALRARFASENATLVEKSPNSGRRGASNATAGSSPGYVSATAAAAASEKARSASSKLMHQAFSPPHSGATRE